MLFIQCVKCVFFEICAGWIVIQWGGYLVRLGVDWEDILIERYDRTG